ncbi:MAG TPA: tRNA uridine-5-carboxymethylaminomethyl(34) synthesis GTPase MnmE [Gemmatimonadaceae bacterium]|nr:tRNA uridine-5-carboxymethylaminomethyl(34) synthesis GTPase MnmE [Gemmatimonadaceae bacterium]
MTLGAAAAIAGAGDTIVAEATVPGRGALAVIRLSGPRAHDITRAIAEAWPSEPRVASLIQLREPDGARLDQAIVLRYDAPSSFTGEDAVEITTHGGTTVPATVVAALIAAGARLAAPGEFTRRAVLNGKLDLLQAEAVADIVAASSRAAQRLALEQLDGGLSRRLLALRSDLLGLEALIAYDIDFPEEDDGPIPRERIMEALAALERSLDELLATADAGELVREGALVVLAGVPNAGKSSLFNALVGRRRAIVTDIPGTTRDAIEAVIDTGKWPLRLVDTAGLRAASEEVERIGVEVSYEYLEQAAVVLVCGATDAEIDAALAACAGRTTAPLIVARTKRDLRSAAAPRSTTSVDVSAVTGAGIDELLARITNTLDHQFVAHPDAPVLTRARHRERVAAARAELKAFRKAWGGGEVPAIVAAVHLRTATIALEELIGRVDVEAILDEVFSRFCVGK